MRMMKENKKHYFKNGVEFFLVNDLFGKMFFVASYREKDKIVHSEEEAFILFKIKLSGSE